MIKTVKPLYSGHHWDLKSAGFSLGLDDMEGDLSPPPHMGGGTSTGGQSSNRGGRMGRDIYFMGGGTRTSNSF